MTTGKVIRIIGPVIDIRFDGMTPPVHTLLYIKDGESTVAAEVAQHLEGGAVRAIALEATEGLSRGLEVISTGAPITIPVGDTMLSRAVDVLGRPIDGKGDVVSDIHMPIHRNAPPYSKQKPVT
ncbi:MAG: F0F1 ATP synthase subunit beta, partial [Clostridia bacterium]|nr:F0F1 ATP synthase subunit beta [Clostridia bacterium]